MKKIKEAGSGVLIPQSGPIVEIKIKQYGDNDPNQIKHTLPPTLFSILVGHNIDNPIFHFDDQDLCIRNNSFILIAGRSFCDASTDAFYQDFPKPVNRD